MKQRDILYALKHESAKITHYPHTGYTVMETRPLKWEPLAKKQLDALIRERFVRLYENEETYQVFIFD